jgi:hypothetical protein
MAMTTDSRPGVAVFLSVAHLAVIGAVLRGGAQEMAFFITVALARRFARFPPTGVNEAVATGGWLAAALQTYAPR